MTPARRWFRSNVWALVVLVPLIVGSVWFSFSTDWADFQDGNPTRILDVPSGKQATYGGGTFYLEQLRVIAGDSQEGKTYGVVDGTDVVVVDVHVTPIEGGDSDDSIGCDVHLMAPFGSGSREWWPESSNPTTFPDGDPDVFGCDIAGGPDYTYREFFVVPAGAADVAPIVQVTILKELPLALHLH